MIDKWIYRFFEALDKAGLIVDKIFGKRCKCKNKKNGK